MNITTKSGFCCEIDPEVLNNMELVDALAEVQKRQQPGLSHGLSADPRQGDPHPPVQPSAQ